METSKQLILKKEIEFFAKAIAKDKEDGNLNKKVKIRVKRVGDVPNNLKGLPYEKDGNYITFLEDGTYKINYSVKDSNNKKTSTTRTVIVNDVEEVESTVAPTTTVTAVPTASPVPTNTPIQTNTPSNTLTPTVAPTTTQRPVNEKIINGMKVSDDIEVIEKYNDLRFDDEININLEYVSYIMDRDYEMLKNYDYMKYIKISANKNGEDISDSIEIFAKNVDEIFEDNYINIVLDVFVEKDGMKQKETISIHFFEYLSDSDYEGYELINENPKIYGITRENLIAKDDSSNKMVKKLVSE